MQNPICVGLLPFARAMAVGHGHIAKGQIRFYNTHTAIAEINTHVSLAHGALPPTITLFTLLIAWH